MLDKISQKLTEIKEENEINPREEDVIKKALSKPIGTMTLLELSKDKSNVVIVISDITRSFQKPWIYLPYLVEEIRQAGVSKDRIKFLVALGTHRRSTMEEHKQLLGELYGSYSIEDSYCEDSCFKTLGTTSYGTKVQINKTALNADLLVITGSIIHHDMAGFSGGRKSILPGIASKQSINMNHSLAMAEEKGYKTFGIRDHVENSSLEKNVINKDMEEVVNMVKPNFLFNVIQDGEGNIVGAVAGHSILAHKQGCEIVEKKAKLKLPEAKAVLWVNCGPFPKDINLYQVSKAVSNGEKAVKDGGDMILIADCQEGIGSSEMEYMFSNFDNNSQREDELRRAFTIGKYAAYLVTTVAQTKQIIIVSSKLKETALKNTGIKVLPNIEAANEYLDEKYGNYDGYYQSSSSKVLEV
ncbi:MAG: nickel-dependent lactate racemase [Filifactoraceae bacterium]